MHIATPPAPIPPSTAHLALPFFDDTHRALAERLVPWAGAQEVDETDDRAACRDWVKRLGAGGWLWWQAKHWAPQRAEFPIQGVLVGARDGVPDFKALRAIGARP